MSAFFDTSSYNSCPIYVTYLDTSLTESNQIMLGAMFFDDFVSSVSNQYDLVQNSCINQTTELFINLMSTSVAAYIGDEMLPMGEDPFFYIAPRQYVSEVSSQTFMTTLNANFAYQASTPFLIDNNAATSYMWTTICQN